MSKLLGGLAWDMHHTFANKAMVDTKDPPCPCTKLSLTHIQGLGLRSCRNSFFEAYLDPKSR